MIESEGRKGIITSCTLHVALDPCLWKIAAASAEFQQACQRRMSFEPLPVIRNFERQGELVSYVV